MQRALKWQKRHTIAIYAFSIIKNALEHSNENTHKLYEYRIMQAGLLRHSLKAISKVIQQNKAISAN